MAVLHAAAAVALAKIAVFHPTDVTPMTVTSLAVLVGAAALWSALDAWLGVDRPGRTWFLAALVAGPVSGVLDVLGRGMFVDETGVGALGAALTGGAAFTALLVLVPAGLGVLVGSRVAAPRGTAGAGDDPAPEPTGDADTGVART